MNFIVIVYTVLFVCMKCLFAMNIYQQNNTASSSDSLQKKESGASPVPASKGGDGSKNKRAASGEADKVAKITDGNTTTTEVCTCICMMLLESAVWFANLFIFIATISCSVGNGLTCPFT